MKCTGQIKFTLDLWGTFLIGFFPSKGTRRVIRSASSWCPLEAPFSREILRPSRGTSANYFCGVGVTKQTCLLSFQYSSMGGKGGKIEKTQKMFKKRKNNHKKKFACLSYYPSLIPQLVVACLFLRVPFTPLAYPASSCTQASPKG